MNDILKCVWVYIYVKVCSIRICVYVWVREEKKGGHGLKNSILWRDLNTLLYICVDKCVRVGVYGVLDYDTHLDVCMYVWEP